MKYKYPNKFSDKGSEKWIIAMRTERQDKTVIHGLLVNLQILTNTKKSELLRDLLVFEFNGPQFTNMRWEFTPEPKTKITTTNCPVLINDNN